MALILSIDTSTKACSTALHLDGQLVASRDLLEDKSHSVRLLGLIDDVLEMAGFKMAEVDAFAVAKGPGSYTGLRIGVSTIKGLCYAMDKPMISVNTLDAMALEVIKEKEHKALYCPMIDARRMEVYCAVFDQNLTVVSDIEAKIIDETSFADFLDKGEVYFFGDGSGKCKEAFGNNSKAIFVNDIHPSAKWVGELAVAKFEQGQFEDVAYFEPFYLKDFVATTPKKVL